VLVLEGALDHQDLLAAAMPMLGEGRAGRIAGQEGGRRGRVGADPIQRAPFHAGVRGGDPGLLGGVDDDALAEIGVHAGVRVHGIPSRKPEVL
jgi:hypothetical protein